MFSHKCIKYEKNERALIRSSIPKRMVSESENQAICFHIFSSSFSKSEDRRLKIDKNIGHKQTDRQQKFV
jgi:hypothetical protein